MTLCLIQTKTVTFTCVVDTMNRTIPGITWFRMDDGVFVTTDGIPGHTNGILSDNNNMVTGRLRVTNVTMNDNGAEYQCSPVRGVDSNSAFLTVLGEIIIISSINTFKYLHMYVRIYCIFLNKASSE